MFLRFTLLLSIPQTWSLNLFQLRILMKQISRQAQGPRHRGWGLPWPSSRYIRYCICHCFCRSSSSSSSSSSSLLLMLMLMSNVKLQDSPFESSSVKFVRIIGLSWNSFLDLFFHHKRWFFRTKSFTGISFEEFCNQSSMFTFREWESAVLTLQRQSILQSFLVRNNLEKSVKP